MPTAYGKLFTFFAVSTNPCYYQRFQLTEGLYRVGCTGCFTIIKFIIKDNHEYTL